MEDFNINCNIFGEHSNLDEWLVADESPVKKRKRQEGPENSGEVRQAKRRTTLWAMKLFKD